MFISNGIIKALDIIIKYKPGLLLSPVSTISSEKLLSVSKLSEISSGGSTEISIAFGMIFAVKLRSVFFPLGSLAKAFA